MPIRDESHLTSPSSTIRFLAGSSVSYIYTKTIRRLDGTGYCGSKGRISELLQWFQRDEAKNTTAHQSNWALQSSSSRGSLLSFHWPRDQIPIRFPGDRPFLWSGAALPMSSRSMFYVSEYDLIVCLQNFIRFLVIALFRAAMHHAPYVNSAILLQRSMFFAGEYKKFLNRFPDLRGHLC